MKKYLLILLCLLLLTGCAGQRVEPVSPAVSGIVDRAAWTMREMMEREPYTFEGTCMSQEMTPGGSAIMEIQVDRLFQGELTVGDTVEMHTMVPGLFNTGEKCLIFAEAGDENTPPAYLISNAALYAVGDTVNRGVFTDTDRLSYEEALGLAEEYAAALQEPGLESSGSSGTGYTQSGSSASYAPWTIEDFIDNYPYVLEGVPVKGDAGEEQLEIRRVYQGDIAADSVVSFRYQGAVSFPAPAAGDDRFLIFAEPAASVFENAFYFRLGAVIYPLGDSINANHMLGLEGCSYDDVIEKVTAYTASHPYSRAVYTAGDFCPSDDIREIFDFSSAVIEAVPQVVLIDTVPDRTTYICQVKDVLKGEDMETATVLTAKHAMKPGEAYLLLLTTPGPDSSTFIIAAQNSVFPADSGEAAQIRSFAE